METLLAGTYVWDDEFLLTFVGEFLYSDSFAFISNDTTWNYVTFSSTQGLVYRNTDYLVEACYTNMVLIGGVTWANENYKTILVETDQTVADDFYTQFTAKTTFTPLASPLTFTPYYQGEEKTASITSGGETTIEATSGKAMTSVTVTIPPLVSGEEISVTENGTTMILSSSAGTYYRNVFLNVNVEPEESALENLVVESTSNGIQQFYPAEPNIGFDEVIVVTDVPTPTPTLQAKSTTITENGTSTVTADSSYDGLSSVAITVNVSGGGGEPTSGEYLVQFIGYGGEILQTGRYDTGDVVDVPSDPDDVLEGSMLFQGWSSPVTITNDTITVGNSDLNIGAMFKTGSDTTEIDITLTLVTGLTATIANCTGVTEIDWGDGETSSEIGTHTYSEYGNYTISITGDISITGSTSQNLFGSNNYYCTAVRFSDSVTSIGDYAFQYCYSLTNITIPNSVTSLGAYAFRTCRSLTSITIPNSVTSIGTRAFYYCYSLTSITIPNSVTSIGDSAIYYCYSLSNITIPNSVTSIGTQAFYYSYSLTNITIPNSVTSIGDSAFYFCYSLTSVIIPNSVTSIGTQAFYYSSAIIEYDFTAFESGDVPTLSNTNALSGINDICKMYFANEAMLLAFSTATNWSTYANYMYVKEDI